MCNGLNKISACTTVKYHKTAICSHCHTIVSLYFANTAILQYGGEPYSPHCLFSHSGASENIPWAIMRPHHRLDGEKPGEQEAHEKLRVRKAELRKLTDDDHIVQYNKYHTANLLSRTEPNYVHWLWHCHHSGCACTTTLHQPIPPTPYLNSTRIDGARQQRRTVGRTYQCKSWG